MLFVFGLPFASFGLIALSTAIRRMLTGTSKGPVWLGLIFGIVFSGIGLGLMFAAILGGRFLKRQQRAQAEHPAEPWLWREDWAQGRANSKTRPGMIGAWVFAALWNAVSMPVLVFVPRAAAKNPAAYVGLVFPVMGVFLLVRAIRLTLAYVEFGKTYFEMTPVPGVIGGELKGMIQARFPHSPDHGVQLRLSCVNRVTSGSGDSQSTWEHIRWREEVSLSPAQLYPGPTGTTIPVSFHIPADARETDTTNLRDAVIWQLEAIANVPGVDYHDVFEVPVFRTAQSPAQASAEGDTTETRAIERPSVFTIQVRQNGTETEFYFPAARNKGFAAGMMVVFLIFGSIALGLVHARAPFIFPLAFGGFSLLLLYGGLQMLLGTTRVTISNGVLRLQKGILGGGKIRQFPLAAIASITYKIAAQQGGGTGTVFYNIELMNSAGRKFTLGYCLRSKQETEWLTEEMRRLTGVQAKAKAASTSQ